VTAGNNVAENPRIVKLLSVFLAVLLYFIPFYQTYFSDPQDDWHDLEIITYPQRKASTEETPYFAENFVNQEKPGVVCHVSSIAVAGQNKLICTWYAGSKEAAGDVAIFSAFFQEDTGKWTAPQILMDPRKSSQELRRWVRKVGNAVVINDRRGGLWLFYSSMLGGWSTTSLNYIKSKDGGKTWSASQKLILSPFFNLTNNVKNQGLSLSRGAYLLPVYHEFLHKFSQVVLLRPEKANLRYEVRRMTNAGKAIQPAIISVGGNNLAAFFRNAAGQGENYILKAESHDVGQNWSELRATSLPNPNSGFAMVRLTDGAILGVINHAFQDRSNLSLVISRDGGLTWKTLKVLENNPEKEYSYPFLTRSPQYYHLTYSYERKRIKHVIFNDAWLEELKAYDY
jgi:predicted neuraminidase